MYDDIALFVHIVQNRGLAAAAKQLDIPAATMTRRLQKLEHSLGCQLIHRSARQFVLTPEGEAHYQAYADLIERLETTRRNLSSEMREMTGKLKILAPTNISNGLLQPMWSRFIKAYPDVQLELHLSNTLEDLLSEQADIALRIGPQKDSQLYQKRLGTLQTVLVASPDYVAEKGAPQTQDELCQHRFIGVKTGIVWRLVNAASGQEHLYYPRAQALANDVTLVSKFVCDGIGISLLPMSEVKAYIESGRMQRILPDWRGPNRDLFAVWPSGRLLSAKAKCLRDHMHDYIQANLAGLA